MAGVVTFVKTNHNLKFPLYSAKYKLPSIPIFSMYCLLEISNSHFFTSNRCLNSLGSCMQTEVLKRQLGRAEAGFTCLSSSFTPHPFLMNGLSPSLSTANRKQTDVREGWLTLPLSPSPPKPVGRSEAQPRRPGAASPCCANKSPFHFN